MKEKPSPMTTPRSAERGTHFAARLPSPVSARTIHNRPVVSAAPTTAAAPTPAANVAWLTAAAPIAFIGCTGNGVRYTNPAAISATPKATSRPLASIFSIDM